MLHQDTGLRRAATAAGKDRRLSSALGFLVTHLSAMACSAAYPHIAFQQLHSQYESTTSHLLPTATVAKWIVESTDGITDRRLWQHVCSQKPSGVTDTHHPPAHLQPQL